MINLIKAGDRTWYMKGWSYAGFYLENDRDVYVIDTGNSEENGMKISQAIEERGWNLAGILNTHGHTDHYGGNAYLQGKYGCPIFANKSEADVINHSELEPYLLNGALAFKEVSEKGLFRADSSVCFDVSDERFPEDIKVIDLRGHSPDHVGYLVPDGTLFAGDAIVGHKDIEKYKVQSIFSPADFLESIERMKSCGAERIVIGHGGIEEELDELIRKNIAAVESVKNTLLKRMEEPAAIDDLIAEIFSTYSMPVNYVQYALMCTIVKSYMAWMKDDNLIEAFADNNRLYWRIAE